MVKVFGVASIKEKVMGEKKNSHKMRISFFDMPLKLGTAYEMEIVFYGAINFITVFIRTLYRTPL
jgi:hypothetical protein